MDGGWTDGKRLIGRQVDVGRDGEMDRWGEMGRWVGGGMEGWVDGWTDQEDLSYKNTARCSDTPRCARP